MLKSVFKFCRNLFIFLGHFKPNFDYIAKNNKNIKYKFNHIHWIKTILGNLVLKQNDSHISLDF